MNPFASQIEFRPAGRGFVEIVLTNRGRDTVVEVLQYSEQGQLIGDPPVDVKNARALNKAAAPLNEILGSI